MNSEEILASISLFFIYFAFLVMLVLAYVVWVSELG